jgi:adenosylcobinamide-phosphate synthase
MRSAPACGRSGGSSCEAGTHRRLRALAGCLTALLMIGALTVDWLLGEPRRWHPLVGFGAIAQRLELWLNPCSADLPDETILEHAARQRWLGALAVLLAVLPPVLLTAISVRLPAVGWALALMVLYLTIGHRSLREHAFAVLQALDRQDLGAARTRVGLIVSRDSAAMQPVEVARAAVESVLENGNDAVFGALFWFAVAGAPGALLYRLVNTLDALWGYRTPRFRYFGWAAARFDDVLNFIPAQLTALSYALLGSTRLALHCWRTQGRQWESPNAGPVMAAGAGSLGLELGGPAWYHGHWKHRPSLGAGQAPQAHDIARALALVARTLLLWMLVVCLAQILNAMVVLRHA